MLISTSIMTTLIMCLAAAAYTGAIEFTSDGIEAEFGRGQRRY